MATTLAFGPFRLETGTAILFLGAEPIPLGRRAVTLLAMLLEQAGAPVSKDALIARAWPGQAVEESNLTVQIAAIRRSIAAAADAAWIETLPRRGYRYVGPPVARSDDDDRAAGMALPLPDRPSIAVLPFANLGGGAIQDYFIDGMVDDIITGLSRINWLFVIARNSTLAYRHRPVDIKQVGRELGVRYVLEGSIRKAAGRVRITGQLVDATTGRHIWADRFDGDLADVFELQDRVTESVVGAIEPSLLNAEIRRAQAKPTESLDAYDLYLRALPHFYSKTRADFHAATVLLRRALSIDPSFTAAKGTLVVVYTQRIAQGWAETGEAEMAIALARECAVEGRDDPISLRSAGHVLALLADEREEGIVLLQRAMQFNPNSAATLVRAGWTYCFAGQPEPAIECLSRALRLDPLGAEVIDATSGLALAHLLAGRLDEALDYTERALHTNPDWRPTLRFRIAALMGVGRVDEARALAQRLLSADPEFRLSTRPVNFGYGTMRETFRNALREAGLPE
jgi:TolB-like protein